MLYLYIYNYKSIYTYVVSSFRQYLYLNICMYVVCITGRDFTTVLYIVLNISLDERSQPVVVCLLLLDVLSINTTYWGPRIGEPPVQPNSWRIWSVWGTEWWLPSMATCTDQSFPQSLPELGMLRKSEAAAGQFTDVSSSQRLQQVSLSNSMR